MFRYTTAIKKIRAMTARKKVIQGGTGAGKTYGIIPILIDRACRTPGLKITVVAETIPAVRDGAADIFKTIMQETNRWRHDGWIGSPMEYTFANKSRIQFKSFENEGKAKASGKRDILFINEANHIAFEIADALMIRSKETYLDFNADFEFWVHREVVPEFNSELLILTYLDNEAVPEETIEDLMIKKEKAFFDIDGDLESANNIKSKHWANWWKVYGQGQIGSISELRIMPLLSKCKEVPDDAIEIPSALDFGFNPDPTVFCRLWVRKLPNGREELYIKQIVYAVKLSINSKSEDSRNLVELLEDAKINKSHLIIAESADPGAIEEMRGAGFSIEAVKKTSVETSIRLFHNYDIFILDGSEQSYSEFNNYKYHKDKNGVIQGIPEPGQADHAIDGTRYVLMSRDYRWSV